MQENEVESKENSETDTLNNTSEKDKLEKAEKEKLEKVEKLKEMMKIKQAIQQDLTQLLSSHDTITLKLRTLGSLQSCCQPIIGTLERLNLEKFEFSKQLKSIETYLKHYQILHEITPFFMTEREPFEFAFHPKMPQLMAQLDQAINFFTEHSGASAAATAFKDADLWLSKTEIVMRKCLIALSDTFLQQLQFLQTEITLELSTSFSFTENSLVDVRCSTIANSLRKLTCEMERRKSFYETIQLLSDCQEAYFNMVRRKFMPKFYESIFKSISYNEQPSDRDAGGGLDRNGSTCTTSEKILKMLNFIRATFINEIHMYQSFFDTGEDFNTINLTTGTLVSYMNELQSLAKKYLLAIIYREIDYVELQKTFLEFKSFQEIHHPDNSDDRLCDTGLFGTFGGDSLLSQFQLELKERFSFRVKVAFYKVLLDDSLWDMHTLVPNSSSRWFPESLSTHMSRSLLLEDLSIEDFLVLKRSHFLAGIYSLTSLLLETHHRRTNEKIVSLSQSKTEQLLHTFLDKTFPLFLNCHDNEKTDILRNGPLHLDQLLVISLNYFLYSAFIKYFQFSFPTMIFQKHQKLIDNLDKTIVEQYFSTWFCTVILMKNSFTRGSDRFHPSTEQQPTADLLMKTLESTFGVSYKKSKFIQKLFSTAMEELVLEVNRSEPSGNAFISAHLE